MILSHEYNCITYRNLFLGYYIPYRHTVPLWEMETDYYLHNRHLETDKGMKAYQESFGVLEWDSEDYTDNATDTGALVRSRSISKSSGLGTNDSINLEQSKKIQRVRDRCSTQNKALSNWWKVAIQRNVQQRMVSDDYTFLGRMFQNFLSCSQSPFLSFSG